MECDMYSTDIGLSRILHRYRDKYRLDCLFFTRDKNNNKSLAIYGTKKRVEIFAAKKSGFIINLLKRLVKYYTASNQNELAAIMKQNIKSYSSNLSA
jgi:hypothetical protein